MRFDRLDLNLLVSLEALLTARSVTAAAEQMHLSQSAMSGALARLRDYFGDELLANRGGRMLPTPLGEALQEPVRNALQLIRSTITDRAEFDPATSDRRFCIVMSDYAAEVLLPLVLARISQDAPDVSIAIASPVGGFSSMLERGEVDLVITLERYLSPTHPRTLLFEDDYVVIAALDNPAVASPFTADAYFGARHVINRVGENEAFAEAFLGLIRERKAAAICPNFSLVPLLVAGSDRIATVHRRQAELYAAMLPLRIVPAPLEIPVVREMMQWHQMRRDDAGVAWLRGQIERTVAASLTAPAAPD